MRVCVLTTSYPRWPGDSAGVFIEDLLGELARTGVRATVVVPSGPGTFPGTSRGGEVEVVRFRYMVPSSLQRVAFGGGLHNNLRRDPWALAGVLPFLFFFCRAALRAAREVDLIHANWTLSGAIGVLCKRRLGKPLVITVHGPDIILGRRWRPMAWLNAFALRGADQVITVGSGFIPDLLALGLPPERINHIPNGIHASLFPPRPPGTRRAVLYIGRLAPEKRVDLLLRAFRHVYAVHPDWRLLIGGDGPLRPSLESLSKELGLGGAVSFLGLIPHEQVGRVMDEADVFVLPSQREGFPVVLVEAMAKGLAVVATDAGSVGDVVKDGQTGLLLPFGCDEQRLANAIAWLINHERVRQELGQQASELVRREYTWHRIAQRTLGVYRKALKGH